MKKGLLIVLSIFIFSCASVQVNYDYERGTDFSAYKTYNYYEPMTMGLSELDTKRFLDALDAGLQAKGMHLSDTPDFLINIKSNQYQEYQKSNVGVGVGGSGRNVGGGISIGIPVGQASINRELIVEFIDDQKRGLFWQAVSASKYQPNAKPEARAAQFDAIVAKILSEYPPAPKK